MADEMPSGSGDKGNTPRDDGKDLNNSIESEQPEAAVNEQHGEAQQNEVSEAPSDESRQSEPAERVVPDSRAHEGLEVNPHHQEQSRPAVPPTEQQEADDVVEIDVVTNDQPPQQNRGENRASNRVVAQAQSQEYSTGKPDFCRGSAESTNTSVLAVDSTEASTSFAVDVLPADPSNSPLPSQGSSPCSEESQSTFQNFAYCKSCKLFFDIRRQAWEHPPHHSICAATDILVHLPIVPGLAPCASNFERESEYGELSPEEMYSSSPEFEPSAPHCEAREEGVFLPFPPPAAPQPLHASSTMMPPDLHFPAYVPAPAAAAAAANLAPFPVLPPSSIHDLVQELDKWYAFHAAIAAISVLARDFGLTRGYAVLYPRNDPDLFHHSFVAPHLPFQPQMSNPYPASKGSGPSQDNGGNSTNSSQNVTSTQVGSMSHVPVYRRTLQTPVRPQASTRPWGPYYRPLHAPVYNSVNAAPHSFTHSAQGQGFVPHPSSAAAGVHITAHVPYYTVPPTTSVSSTAHMTVDNTNSYRQVGQPYAPSAIRHDLMPHMPINNGSRGIPVSYATCMPSDTGPTQSTPQRSSNNAPQFSSLFPGANAFNTAAAQNVTSHQPPFVPSGPENTLPVQSTGQQTVPGASASSSYPHPSAIRNQQTILRSISRESASVANFYEYISSEDEE